MGWRFQYRPRLGPFRLNIGKRGLTSISAGRRGGWVNFSRKGTRTSIGAPGTGLRWTSDLRPYGSRTRSRGVLWLLIAALIITAALVALARN